MLVARENHLVKEDAWQQKGGKVIGWQRFTPQLMKIPILFF